MVAGKPLLAWSIQAAQNSKYIDRLIISSDDNEIISVAKKFGCDAPFVRPYKLSNDTAITYDVALHAIDSLDDNFDILIILQPTSPLRSTEDIDSCIELSLFTGSCVSLVETDKSPYWMYQLPTDISMVPVLKSDRPILRRQDAPSAFLLNGAVYAVNCDWLKLNGSFIGVDTVPYVMPKDRSLDIDTYDDFEIVEKLLERQKLA
jgi:N-acylneuraminate cytidylyltransferase